MCGDAEMGSVMQVLRLDEVVACAWGLSWVVEVEKHIYGRCERLLLGMLSVTGINKNISISLVLLCSIVMKRLSFFSGFEGPSLV